MAEGPREWWGCRQSIGSIRSRALRVAAAAGYAAVASLTRLGLLAAGPLIVVALRGSVRNRRFWERGLGRAWHRKVCCSLCVGS